MNLYTPASTRGYCLGVVGALMMPALLLYPLRKNPRFMQNWGPPSFWFRVHMLFGITGPILILFRSAFHFGSLNAAVTLTQNTGGVQQKEASRRSYSVGYRWDF